MSNMMDCTFTAQQYFYVVDIFECVTLYIVISGHENVIVSCLYRSPGSNINTFSKHLEQIFIAQNSFPLW